MKKRLSSSIEILGGILILLGIVALCFVQFWIEPMCRRKDPVFYRKLSKKAYWDYIQNNIHEHGWTHDDFSPVGDYGNEKWAEWIMDKALKGESISDCGEIGHKDAAMESITNQKPENGNTTEKKWLNWWSKNKNKTQLEWIQDGFLKYGVKVSVPATPNEYKSLLKLLGSKENKTKNEGSKIPGYVKYNAFRWLRDSGFNPIAYALKSIDKSSSKDEINGLYVYQQRFQYSSKKNSVGILPLTEAAKEIINNPMYGEEPRPMFYEPKVQLVVYLIVFFPIILGAILILLFYKKTDKVE